MYYAHREWIKILIFSFCSCGQHLPSVPEDLVNWVRRRSYSLPASISLNVQTDETIMDSIITDVSVVESTLDVSATVGCISEDILRTSITSILSHEFQPVHSCAIDIDTTKQPAARSGWVSTDGIDSVIWTSKSGRDTHESTQKAMCNSDVSPALNSAPGSGVGNNNVLMVELLTSIASHRLK